MYLYFAIPLVVAVITVSLLISVFQGRSTEDIVQDQPDQDATSKIDEDAGVPLVGAGEMGEEEEEFAGEKAQAASGNKLNQLFNESAVLWIVTFIIIYVSLKWYVGRQH